MQLAHYIGLLHRSQCDLGEAFREVGRAHADEADVFHICQKLARHCDRHAGELQPFADRYGEDAPEEPDRLHGELFTGTREGPIGQAAQGARDEALLEVVQSCERETATQMRWLRTRMKQAAPQALVVS